VIRTVEQFVHAYRVTPSRLHRQWIGNFLLVVVALAMTAALYLDVTSQAAIAGREVQELRSALNTGRHAIADLETELAASTSASAMQGRALALGFVPMETGDAEYVLVPGYQPPEPEILTSSKLPEFRAASIAPEYTLSLLDWLDQAVGSLFPGGRLP